jgi:hypothetical protein
MRAQSLVTWSGLLLLAAVATAANAAPETRAAAPQARAEAGIQLADSSQANQVSPAGPSTNAVAPVDKKICKRIESTVSRVAKRVCLTKQEWDQVEQEIR